jgi:hypothetical protein
VSSKSIAAARGSRSSFGVCFVLVLGLVSGCGDSGSEPDAGAGQGGGAQSGNGGASGSAELGGEGGAGNEGGDVPYPQLLSETGLYADIASYSVASDFEPYRPVYELWSDGAEKVRWVRLPAGASIDTSDLDYWSYPVGTELFKEFWVDGMRIETRLLRKRSDGWVRVAYLWNEDETDAVAVPDGARNARGTKHDVPSMKTCAVCHDKMPDNVLGFTLLELAHEGDGVTLAGLAESGRLTHPPAEMPVIPGNATARAALGYLHANCGICHNPESFVTSVTEIDFWLAADRLGSVEETTTYATSVDVPALNVPDADAVIASGDPEASAVILRMQERDSEEQMPPVGSEVVDGAGLEVVSAWIESL